MHNIGRERLSRVPKTASGMPRAVAVGYKPTGGLVFVAHDALRHDPGSEIKLPVVRYEQRESSPICRYHPLQFCRL